MTRLTQSRRRFLETATAVGVLGNAAALAGAQTQTFRLGGVTEAWQGRAPSSIEGEANPTLQLQAGQDYAIVWENVDGQPHNVAILDANENELVGTQIISGQGQTQTLEFTATEEMAEYYCAVHPNSMRGAVEIGEGGGDGGGGGEDGGGGGEDGGGDGGDGDEDPEQGGDGDEASDQPGVTDVLLTDAGWRDPQTGRQGGPQEEIRQMVALPTDSPVASEEVGCTTQGTEEYDRYTAVVVSKDPIRSDRAHRLLDLHAVEVDLLAQSSMNQGVYGSRYTVDDCFNAPYVRAGLASTSRSDLDAFLSDSLVGPDALDWLVGQLSG